MPLSPSQPKRGHLRGPKKETKNTKSDATGRLVPTGQSVSGPSYDPDIPEVQGAAPLADDTLQGPDTLGVIPHAPIPNSRRISDGVGGLVRHTLSSKNPEHEEDEEESIGEALNRSREEDEEIIPKRK